MVMALVLMCFAVFGGIVLTYLFDQKASFAARIGAAIVIGFMLMAFSGLVLASFLPLNRMLLLLLVIVCASPAILFADSEFRTNVASDLAKRIHGLKCTVLHPTGARLSYPLFYA